MHAKVCRYPAVLSGPPLVSRVWEVAFSLPVRGHWKTRSFFPWEMFPVCQNFVWCVCFCSGHMASTMSRLSTTKLIFHTHRICSQSSFFFSVETRKLFFIFYQNLKHFIYQQMTITFNLYWTGLNCDQQCSLEKAPKSCTHSK